MKKILLLVLACIISTGLIAQISTEDSQILYLDFEDDTEFALNDQDVDAVDEADLTAEEGKFGGAVSFNGTSSYLVMDLIEDWNHGMDWTLSFWVKSAVENQFVWGITSFSAYSGDPAGDYFDDEARVGGLKLGMPDEENVGKLIVEISWIGDFWPEDDVPAWDDTEWHHFVITYSVEAATMNMYLDNEPYGEEEIAIAADLEGIIAEEGFEGATLEDDNFKLGFAGNGWGPDEAVDPPEGIFFEGLMDDVRLFDIPLTVEEVAEIYNYAPSGVNSLKSNPQFHILPNPASEYIMVKSKTIRDLDIFNAVGQLVLSEKNVQDGSTISISNLSKGLYFVKSGDETQKLIIE